jgi:carbamoyltransferase
MNILAISFNHDGAGVILADGRIAGYVNTERFSRRKKHPGIRECDIENLLSQAGIMIEHIDLVQLINLNNMDSPDIPKLHNTTLKETWPDFWVNGTFTKIRILGTTLPCSLTQEHHIFHAALAYYFSSFESGVSFACDPVAASAHFFKATRLVQITPRRRYNSPFVYAKISELLFGSALIGAGKLMALAPFGSRDAREIDYGELVRLAPQTAYEALLKLANDGPVEFLEGGMPLNASLAFHAQAFLEFELLGILDDLYTTCVALGLEPNLCLSGGTALNSVANQHCFERSRFQDIYVHPACGDDGTAIGAALLHWHSVEKQPKMRRSNREAMYSCRTYDRQIPDAIDKYQSRLIVRETPNYIKEAAQLIAQGKL